MVNQKNREVRAGLKPECELTRKRNVQNKLDCACSFLVKSRNFFAEVCP